MRATLRIPCSERSLPPVFPAVKAVHADGGRASSEMNELEPKQRSVESDGAAFCRRGYLVYVPFDIFKAIADPSFPLPARPITISLLYRREFGAAPPSPAKSHFVRRNAIQYCCEAAIAWPSGPEAARQQQIFA